MVGLVDSEQTLRTRDGQTDRQTLGQTSCHDIVRSMHMLRKVKRHWSAR